MVPAIAASVALRHPDGAGRIDGVHHRPQLPDRVRAAGGGVVVGRVVERLDGDGDGVVLRAGWAARAS